MSTQVMVGSLVAALVGAAVGAAVAVTLLAKPAPTCDTDLLRADVASMRAELVALRAKLAEAPPAPAPAPDPAPSSVTLQIMSDPPGADLVDGSGRLLGRTPVVLALPASSTPRTFKLRLSGYADTTFEVMPDKDTTFTFSLSLSKRAAAEKPNPYQAPRADSDLSGNPFESR